MFGALAGGEGGVLRTMRLFPFSSSSDSSPTEENNIETSKAMLYLNVYDLTPVNNYLYWFGLGIYHSGIEATRLYSVLSCFKSITEFNQLDARASKISAQMAAFNMNLEYGSSDKSKEFLNLTLDWRQFVQLKQHISIASVLKDTKKIRSQIRVHGMEYGFGAHEYPTSGVFEVEPRSCPGFIFRRSILLGSTDMSRSEFRSFMEHLSNQYHGDTYHLISKNCNHFTDEVCQRLTGKPIPGWVNRLARVGSFCNCLLPESIQATSIRHLPENQMNSEDGSDSGASSVTGESETEDLDHHLLLTPNSDVAFLKDKPVKLAKNVL